VRGYYLNVEYQWGDPLNQAIINYDSFQSWTDLDQALDQSSVTHILLSRADNMYWKDFAYYTPHTRLLIEDLLRNKARLLYSEGDFSVYKREEIPVVANSF
jgi:hypothetical protein